MRFSLQRLLSLSVMVWLTIGLLFAKSDELTFRVLAPTVNLGPDTSACDSLILDAGNAGASYLWSTGDTTQTLTVTQSDTIWVQVTDMTGTSGDTLVVWIYAQPGDPIIGDTAVCGPGQYSLIGSHGGDFLVWYEEPSGGDFLAIGDTFTQFYGDSTTLYVESINGRMPSRVGLDTFGNSSNGNFFLINSPRGLVFDVLNTLTISEVTIFTNGATTGMVLLEDANGNGLDSINVNLPVTGKNVAPINFTIAPGTNYKLLFTNRSGGSLYIDFPQSYPLTSPDLTIKAGTPISSHYNFLYDWKINVHDRCASNRIPVLVAVRPAPVVTLGNDTTLCGGSSLLLDASNPGATYLWSTGAMSATLNVINSGTYYVDVDLNGCMENDTINVDAFSTPIDPMVTDSAICGPQDFYLTASHLGNHLLWFDSLQGGTQIGTGDSLLVSVTDSSTFYAQSLNGKVPSLAGLDSIGNSSNGNYYAVGNTRGLRFNALSDLVLNEVSVYVGTVPMTAEVSLVDSGGQILFSRMLSFTDTGENVIVLNWRMKAAPNYLLQMGNISAGGQLYIDLPVSYPMNYQEVLITSGTPISSHYNFFYNWKIDLYDNCASNRVPMNVFVRPSPVVALGPDSTLCGGSNLSLDASNAGASYLWSTGATTSTLVVDTTGTYYVDVDLNGCVETDTVKVAAFVIPADPVISDTSVCGPGTVALSISKTGSDVSWYGSLTGSDLLTSGDTLKIPIVDTTTVYVETLNGRVPSEAGLDSVDMPGNFFAPSVRSIVFDALSDFTLNEVSMYVINPPLTGAIRLKDGAGNILEESIVTLTDSGRNIVSLNYRIDTGLDYKLEYAYQSGTGQMMISLPVIFPFVYPDLVMKSGTPIANHYNFFYDWKINRSDNCVSNRQPLTVLVLQAPIVDLGLDTVLCGGNSYTLDASYPGASYLWNTGDTTATLLVNTSDTFTVVANIGPCLTTDEIKVKAYATPPPPTINDTTLCGPGLVTLKATTSARDILWYDDASQNNLLQIGDTLDLLVEDTTLIYTQALNGSVPLTVGFDTIGFSSNGNYFNINPTDERGLTFSTSQAFVLSSVTIYVDDSTTALVRLVDRNGIEINRREVVMPDSGGNEVDLRFFVPVGNSFQLLLSERSGGGLFLDQPIAYPILEDYILIQSGTPISTHYNYFYSWKINRDEFCGSPLAPVEVAVKYPKVLPNYEFDCDSVVLSGGQAPGNYLWSTGETSRDITVYSSGTYTLERSDTQGCMVLDSSVVEIPQEAGLPDDGILCGNILRTNYGQTARYLWSTGDTTSTITITMPGTYFVQLIEPQGDCVLNDTITVTGFDSFPMVDLGPDQAVCEGVTLNAGNPGLEYNWSTGDTSQQILVVSSGFYWVEVTNGNGCTSGDTVAISVTQLPTASFIAQVIGFDLILNNQSTFGTFCWDFGDGNSAKGVAPSHTYLDTGDFVVTLIVINQCGEDTITQTVRVGATVSIEDELAEAEINIYPNPASDVLNLEIIHEGLDDLQTSLTDQMGRLVQTKDIQKVRGSHIERLTLQGLSAGIYYLMIESRTSRMVKKVYVK